MVILRFQFLCLISLLFIPRNGRGNEKINLQESNADYSKRQYETESSIGTPNKSMDNLLKYKENKRKEKDGYGRKCEAILPSVFKGSLNTGLVLPTGINAQLNPEINLRLDQGIIPNLIGQSSCNANTAKYPVQFLALNPMVDDKKLNDLKIDGIPPVILNTTLDKASKSILENIQNINTVATNNNINMVDVNSTNKSQDTINRTVPQIESQNILNVNSLNNTKLMSNNECNKINVSLISHQDDYFLKNLSNKVMDKTHDIPLLHNSTNLESSHSEENTIAQSEILETVKETVEFNENKIIGTNVLSKYDKNDENYNIFEITVNEGNYYLNKGEHAQEPQPVLTISEGKKNTRCDNYDTKSINKQEKYPDLEKVKVNGQNTNTLNYDEPKNKPANYKINSDGYNKPQFEYPFEDQNANAYLYQRPESALENYITYGNANDYKPFNNVNSNKVIKEYANTFKYPVNDQNANAYYYQGLENIPENHYNNDKDLLYMYNENRNNAIQDYKNIRPELKYALEDQNKNTYHYQRPDILAETHKTDSNGNNIRVVYKKIKNDDATISRNLKLYYTNNNPSYIKVNLDCEQSANPKRIQNYCNQHSPLINCNGFYGNENTPATYPSYFYYPCVYRNVYS